MSCVGSRFCRNVIGAEHVPSDLALGCHVSLICWGARDLPALMSARLSCSHGIVSARCTAKRAKDAHTVSYSLVCCVWARGAGMFSLVLGCAWSNFLQFIKHSI